MRDHRHEFVFQSIQLALLRHIVEHIETTLIFVRAGADRGRDQIEFAAARKNLGDRFGKILFRVGNRVLDKLMKFLRLFQDALEIVMEILQRMTDDFARMSAKEMPAKTPVDRDDALIRRHHQHAVCRGIENRARFGLRPFDVGEECLEFCLRVAAFLDLFLRLGVQIRVFHCQRSEPPKAIQQLDVFDVDLTMRFEIRNAQHADGFQAGAERDANDRVNPFELGRVMFPFCVMLHRERLAGLPDDACRALSAFQFKPLMLDEPANPNSNL